MTTVIMIELLFMPILAGMGLSLVSGPLGCFIVWRRMAYFGETVAHAALVGVAIGVATRVNITLSIVLVTALLAFFFGAMVTDKKGTSNDTLLGIFSHGSLALGLILISLMASQRVNMMGLLTGDILSVTPLDVCVMYAVVAAALVVVVAIWRQLLLLVIDEDLAAVEGHDINKLKIILSMLVAVVIAVSVKIVGVLLIAALLIIPAAASRKVSRSPEAMAIVASAISMCCILFGFTLSYFLDIPVGPAIVVCAIISFLVASPFRQ